MKVFAFCMAMLASSLAWSQAVTVILPVPVGSLTDNLLRIIQDEYNKLPGKKMTLDHAPGGNQLVAVNKFLNSTDPNVILATTATINIFNPLLIKNLPYTDKDFLHVAYLGQTATWYIANSRYRTMDDMLRVLPANKSAAIGSYASAHNINVLMLKGNKLLDDRVQIVNYKGAPQLMTDILGNHIDVAVVAITPAIIQQAKAGQLSILGNSTGQTLNIDGISVPSVGKTLNVPQMTSGAYLSARTTADLVFVKQFESDVQQILSRPDVRAKIRQLYVFGDPSFGHTTVTNFIQSQRKTASAYADKLGN